MPPASSSVVTSASSMSSSDSDISLPPSPPPSPPHDPYAFASSDEDSAAPPAKKTKPRNMGLLPRLPRPRLWPGADELALLEALAALKEQHGRLPSTAELAAAVADSLPHASAEQVDYQQKLLRQRYEHSVGRLRRGTVPVTDDDVRIFRLSKRIWEGEPRMPSRRRPRAEPHHERRSFEELRAMYPCLAAEVEAIAGRSAHPETLKYAFELVGDEPAARLEAKIKKLRVAQMKADMRSAELSSAVAQAIIGAMD